MAVSSSWSRAMPLASKTEAQIAALLVMSTRTNSSKSAPISNAVRACAPAGSATRAGLKRLWVFAIDEGRVRATPNLARQDQGQQIEAIQQQPHEGGERRQPCHDRHEGSYAPSSLRSYVARGGERGSGPACL